MNGHIVTRTGKKTIKGKPEKLYYVVYYMNGKQKWEKVRSGAPDRRTHAIKEDAQKLLTKRLSEINAGEYVELKRATFAEFKDKWLEQYGNGSIRPSSLATFYGFFDNHLIPAFGDKPLASITVEHIEAFKGQKLTQPKDLVRRQKEGKASGADAHLSPQTVKHLLRLLRQMLDHAVDWGYLRTNPARKVKNPKIEKKEMDCYTPADVRKFLNSVPEKWYPFFLVAISTGLRIGELLAMRWANLDISNRQYHVKETWQRSRGGKQVYFSVPKTKSSVAPVDLMPEAIEALEQHRIRQAAEKLEAGERYQKKDLIFATPTGGPLDDAHIIQRVYRPAIAEAGLRVIRFHDLRHTTASLLIAQGENPKYVQKQLRHASIEITLDRYGHLYPDANQKAMAGMSRALFGEEEEPAQEQKAAQDI